MKKAEFNNYLKSEEWRQIKRAVKEKYRTCVFCDAGKDLNVHHRHYRTTGHEDIEKDLTLLCRNCHRKFHLKAIKRKESKKSNKHERLKAQLSRLQEQDRKTGIQQVSKRFVGSKFRSFKRAKD